MADITKILKFISVDNGSFELVDNTIKIQNIFDNIKNAIVYNHDKHILYFVDSENDEGIAKQINAPNEYPLKIVKGDSSVLSYNGSQEIIMDTSTLHKVYEVDPSFFNTTYTDGKLNCPLISVDNFGHITNVSRITLTLTGDNDASLVTVSKARVLFGEFAAKYEIKVIGKGTEIGYILPGENISTGQSFKCIDAHEYYYADGVTLIQYTDKEGKLKNPGAGDIIICDKKDPSIHWSVIVNQNEIFSDVLNGLVPASGQMTNGILYGDASWRNLIGGSGIKIENDNQTISHDNVVPSGTGGQNPDVIDIPHYAEHGQNIFSFKVPRFTYDNNGHVTGVKDCSVNIEVCDIRHGEFPIFTVKHKNSSGSIVETIYNPEVGDASVDLTDIKAKLSENSEKFANRTVSTLVSDFTSPEYKDVTIPTAGNTADFVKEYVEVITDASLNNQSTHPLQNKIITNALARKADLSDVITKTNTVEYIPTDNYNPATKKYVDDGDTFLAGSKQDKITPGIGVSFEDGILSFNGDMFKVVDGYLIKKESGDYTDDMESRVSNPLEDKVYIIRLKDSSAKVTDKPIYIEFTYNFTLLKWIQIGQFTLDVMIEDKFKSLENSINELKNNHVYLSEEEYEQLRVKDPTKLYLIYESDEPYVPEDDIEATVEGTTISLTINPEYTSYDPLTSTISINSSHIAVENNVVVIN